MEEGELLDAEAEGHQTSYIDPISRLMNELLCCLHDVQMNLLFGTHKSGNFSSVVQFLWKLQSHSDTLVQWYCKETNKGRYKDLHASLHCVVYMLLLIYLNGLCLSASSDN